MEKYITPFIVSFLLSVFFIVISIYVSGKINWKGRISGRHIHAKGKNKIFRTGGIAMILAFNLSILINQDLFLPPELYGIMIATLLLMVLGTLDDFKEIIWKIQLFFQIAISLMVFIMGVRIHYVTNPMTGNILNLDTGIGPVFSILLVMFWIVMLINSMNWLDGIDGLSGGVSFIGSLTIFFLSLKPEVNQPPVAIISMIIAGSVLGFLVFNFHPSRVLAGTAGAMFMGFLLASMAIFSGTKIATAILVMAIPIIDFLWVIGERIRNKKSIFKPDKNHLHYKLLELGWSQRKVNIVFYLITAMLAVVALNTRAIGKSITFLLAVIIMAAFLVAVNKKIKKLSLQK